MKNRNYLKQLKANWVAIVAVLALFLGGTSNYSNFIRYENFEVTKENNRMEEVIPGGELIGYYVDIVFTKEYGTHGEGVPEVKYFRDRVLQNLYVVLDGTPNNINIDKHYNYFWFDWEVDQVYNIREVGTVRRADESTPPVGIIEDSQAPKE